MAVAVSVEEWKAASSFWQPPRRVIIPATIDTRHHRAMSDVGQERGMQDS
jgi:hypothetical protein